MKVKTKKETFHLESLRELGWSQTVLEKGVDPCSFFGGSSRNIISKSYLIFYNQFQYTLLALKISCVNKMPCLIFFHQRFAFFFFFLAVSSSFFGLCVARRVFPSLSLSLSYDAPPFPFCGTNCVAVGFVVALFAHV